MEGSAKKESDERASAQAEPPALSALGAVCAEEEEEDDDDDELPERLLEALEWFAESVRAARVTVAEVLRHIDEATARMADGR